MSFSLSANPHGSDSNLIQPEPSYVPAQVGLLTRPYNGPFPTAAANAAAAAYAAANAAGAAAATASSSGVMSRAPQKYLIQNQSGMKVYYWTDGSRVSVRGLAGQGRARCGAAVQGRRGSNPCWPPGLPAFCAHGSPAARGWRQGQ